VVAVSLGLSIFINIGHAFQFYINDGSNYSAILSDTHLYTTYPAINSNSKALCVFLLIYFLINYLVFLLINTVVEMR
jgi:hypothetical protein